MKLCPKCSSLKEPSEFHTRSDKPGQLQSWCKQCGLKFNRNKYAKNPGPQKEAHSIYYLANQTKTDKRNRKWARNHPEARRETDKKSREKAKRERPEIVEDRRLRQAYGISLEQFDERMLNQGGCCAVCDREVKLCVDHCHKTNRVRGLLCGNCNRAIGLLFDSPESARKAAEYLS